MSTFQHPKLTILLFMEMKHHLPSSMELELIKLLHTNHKEQKLLPLNRRRREATTQIST